MSGPYEGKRPYGKWRSCKGSCSFSSRSGSASSSATNTSSPTGGGGEGEQCGLWAGNQGRSPFFLSFFFWFFDCPTVDAVALLLWR